jgi:hypothetical protein
VQPWLYSLGLFPYSGGVALTPMSRMGFHRGDLSRIGVPTNRGNWSLSWMVGDNLMFHIGVVVPGWPIEYVVLKGELYGAQVPGCTHQKRLS